MNAPQTSQLLLFLGATAVRATLLLLAAAGAGLLLHRAASASARHLLWALALAGLLLLPLASPLLPRWSLAVLSPAPAQAAAPVAVASPGPAAAIVAGPAAISPPTARVEAPRGGRTASLPAGALLVGVYLFGAGMLLVRLARQQRRLVRLGATASPVTAREWVDALSAGRAELGIRRPVRLVRAGASSMPMTWGALRPVVAVPADAEVWPAERRTAVLLHELAHVARCDALVQAVAAVACALYWFHPGVWLLARQLRRESEAACDDRVLLAGARPRAYAGELLAVARSFSAAATPALAVGMASRSQLESRLRALLDAGRARGAPGWPSRIAAALVTAMVLGSLASAQLTRRPVLRTQVQPTPTAGARAMRLDRGRAPDARRGRENAPVAPADAPVPAFLAAVSASAQEGLTGRWELGAQSFGVERPGYGQLQMRLTPHSYSGTTIALSRFSGLGGAIPGGTAPARFELRGEAGTILFEGEFRGGEGAGTFRFTPAPGFAAELRRRGLGTATAEDLARAVIFDVTLAKADALLAVLGEKPSIDDLTRLIGHLVTPDYVRQLAAIGYRNASAEDIIRLSNHGVEIAWIREVQAAGYREASVEDLIRLRNHGIDIPWIREMQSLGYREATIEDLIRMKNNGVDAGWIRGLQGIGYRTSTPEDMIRMKNNGVEIGWIRSLQSLGYTSLTSEDLVRMRNNNVDVGFIRTLQGLGYSRVSAEDLIRMQNRGITPDFIRSENARRGTRLSPDELIRALTHRGG